MNERKGKISTCVYVHSILHHWACILIFEGYFIEYVCWWEFVCELSEILFFFVFTLSCILREMSDLLLGALGHCPFHHYIHCWCDFTSCWIWANHHSSLCSSLHHHSHFWFWFIILISPLVIFLQQPISRFDTFFASSLHTSLSVWFSSLCCCCYHIHIRYL